MNKIIIMSRLEAERTIPIIPTTNGVISITDPLNEDTAVFNINDFTKDVLYLKFFDIDGYNQSTLKCLPQRYHDGLCKPKYAAQILDFVDKVKDEVEVLIVHCDAGISRSAGVAAAISYIYKGSDEWVFKSNLYIPNRFVYRLILNEHTRRLK